MKKTIAFSSYDELGQLKSKRLGVTSSGQIEILNYEYNIGGWLKAINKSFVTTGKTDVYRDNFGNITASKTYQLNGGRDTVTVSYLNLLNSDSLAVACQLLNVQDGSLIGTIEYTFDNRKRLIGVKNFSVEDTARSLESVETYSYDSSGNKLLAINEKIASKRSSKEVNEYSSRR